MGIETPEIAVYPSESASRAAGLPSVSSRDVLIEISGHLHAALVQSLPTDDQIILQHVRSAHALVQLLLKAKQ